MPTIAEIIAAKKAGAIPAKTPQATASKAPPAESLTDKLEAKAAIDRIDPPGKYLARQKSVAGLVLRAGPDDGKAEPRGQRTEIRGPQEPEPRNLARTAGEGIDMTPAAADAETATWHAALNSFETDMVVLRDPAEAEVCWLAVRPLRPGLPPILLHRLPWALMEHPATPLPEGEPY